MRLVVCAVLLLALNGSALPRRNEHWWKIFPNLDKEDSSSQESSFSAPQTVPEKTEISTGDAKMDHVYVYEGIDFDSENSQEDKEGSGSGVELNENLNLDNQTKFSNPIDNVNIKFESTDNPVNPNYENNQDEKEGGGSAVKLDENVNSDNKTEVAALPTENISDTDNDNLEWSVDKNSNEKRTDEDHQTESKLESMEYDENSSSEKTDVHNDDYPEPILHENSDILENTKVEEEEVDHKDDHPEPIYDEEPETVENTNVEEEVVDHNEDHPEPKFDEEPEIIENTKVEDEEKVDHNDDHPEPKIDEEPETIENTNVKEEVIDHNDDHPEPIYDEESETVENTNVEEEVVDHDDDHPEPQFDEESETVENTNVEEEVVDHDEDHPEPKFDEESETVENTNVEEEVVDHDDDHPEPKFDEESEIVENTNVEEEVVDHDDDHPEPKLDEEPETFENTNVEEVDHNDDHPEPKFDEESEIVENTNVEEEEIDHNDNHPEPKFDVESDATKTEENENDDEENGLSSQEKLNSENQSDESTKTWNVNNRRMIISDDDLNEDSKTLAETIDEKKSDSEDEDQLAPVASGDSVDETLHWVDEEPIPGSETSTNSGLQVNSTNTETLPIAVPMVPMFRTEACSFEKLPFNLNLQPATSSHLQGIDKILLCELVPLNTSISMPSFRLTWSFEKPNCKTDGKNTTSCKTVLISMNYESLNSSYTLPYTLLKLNHSSHTGKYSCEAEIYGCQSQKPEAVRMTESLNIRVYTKPNYGLHIGIIAGICVLLLAILAGLVYYGRRVQNRSKNRYQELLASTDIQYFPSKVLELPNSVYNATTTKFTRMSASTFSSKSSFTSNDEV